MYRTDRDKRKNEAKLISNLKTETGVDVICSSCLQYKSKSLCKTSESISNVQAEKYLVKFCSLLKN